jgi:hypothetical protein
MSDNHASSDKNTLDQVVSAFQRMSVPERPKVEETLAIFQSKRGFFMQPRFHIATAATILIGVGVWWLLSPATSFALAEVIQAAERHGLVRYRGEITVEDKNGTNTVVSTSYVDLKEHRTREESFGPTADGKPGKLRLIHVVHETSRRYLMVYPEDKTAYLGTQSSKNGAQALLEQLREMQGDKLTTMEKEKLDGKETLKYKFEEDGRTSIVWVDPLSKLPIRIEVTALHPLGMRIRLISTAFEWDPQVAGRAELFDLIPPAGYKVVEDNADNSEK